MNTGTYRRNLKGNVRSCMKSTAIGMVLQSNANVKVHFSVGNWSCVIVRSQVRKTEQMVKNLCYKGRNHHVRNQHSLVVKHGNMCIKRI